MATNTLEAMAPFLAELSSLEVEPLEIVADAPKPERSLDTLTTTSGKVDIDVALTVRGVMPVNTECAEAGACQACCCVFCWD